MDFGKLFRNVSPEMGSNLTIKIGNPPKLKVNNELCARDLMGRDLLSRSSGVWDPSSSSASIAPHEWPEI